MGEDMKRDVLACNIIFPAFMLYYGALLFPMLIAVLAPLNFIADTLMLFLLYFLLKLPDKKRLYRSMIVKTWGLGFLADFVASFIMTCIGSGLGRVIPSFRIYSNTPWKEPNLFLFITAGIALAGALIYVFQRKIVLKGLALEEGQKHRLALGMAILTAPYMMYLPPI